MDIQKIKINILELCSESEHGSWEFWSNKEVKTKEEGKNIFQAIASLIKEEEIIPVEYENVTDHSYKKAVFEIDRLRTEIDKSISIENVDSKTFYWFIATEKGKEEDILNRGQI